MAFDGITIANIVKELNASHDQTCKRAGKTGHLRKCIPAADLSVQR